MGRKAEGRNPIYVRCVTMRSNGDSGVPEGIFQAASDLRNANELPPYDAERLLDILKWFGGRLQRPLRFTRSRRPHRKNKAISWFKSSAVEHIAKAREVVQLLEEHGWQVRTVKTDRPGYIVYEDDFQVAAEPFASTDV